MLNTRSTGRRKVPWALIKQIRQRETEGQGFLRTEDLFELADRLTPEQLRHLGREFPVLTNVASRRDLVSLCYQMKDGITKLRSDEGLPLTENVIDSNVGGYFAPFLKFSAAENGPSSFEISMARR